MDGPLVSLRGVGKTFGAARVLDGVDLDVARGEVVCIIGPSGSGKSTLLRCINFIGAPSEGMVTFDGADYHPVRDHRWNPFGGRREERRHVQLRAEIGMVFQHFNVFPHLTARENVMLGLRKTRRLGKKDAFRIADEQLVAVGLADKADQYPQQLSGGQKQRVAIARALALSPKLMLFDEATSSLDPELVNGVLDLMKQLAADGMTMIVVTHELRFAFEAADRIVFMDHGRVVEEGPTAQFGSPLQERTRLFLSALDR